ncbi:MAG: maleylacetoacetate isomerase [Myxococcaceae bacterium]|nr:maleylacetoacetate isomerase [Myxococcaceae bacterium]MCI0671876.1 maleylacetoacetate isomerase [Myxococcaceae bacterium]
MSATLRLHSYWRSSCSWRVRIALHHKGLPFEYVAVHLVKDGGEQHRPEYREKNALGMVPTLEVTESGTTRFLGQSLAILEWLEERYPQPALLPKDAYLRAAARQMAEAVNSSIQPLQNLSVLQYVKGTLHGDDKAWCQHWIGRGMAALEQMAHKHAGRYLVGDEVTLADACLVPQMYGARRFGVDPSQYPTLLRVEQACAALPAFQRAHADAQPDAQPTSR